MDKKNIGIFLQEIEIPDVVQEAAEDAFAQIRQESESNLISGREKFGRRKKKFYLPRAAAILIAGFLISGTTVAAVELVNRYKERMEEMNQESLEAYYAIVADTTLYNRDFTKEEYRRYEELGEAYVENGLFPEKTIPVLKEGEEYKGKGIALDAATCTINLPERELKDEELLEIIDFNKKVEYSIYEVNREKIINGDDWMSRMELLDDAAIDYIYINMCSAQTDISGGYSRELSEEESSRYEELNRQYEEEGVYSEEGIAVIQQPEDFVGEAVAICVWDGNFYLPERELTDEEMLQIIDAQHKIPYCLGRIGDEIRMGFRKGYPKMDEETGVVTEGEVAEAIFRIQVTFPDGTEQLFETKEAQKIMNELGLWGNKPEIKGFDEERCLTYVTVDEEQAKQIEELFAE